MYKIEEKAFNATEINKIAFLKLVSISLPGPNLDFLCIRQSHAVPIQENYAKLYFHAQHIEKGLNKRGGRGGGVGRSKNFGAFFYKKVHFLASIRRCPKFLE